MENLKALEEKYQALMAENAALRADAKRYCWWRRDHVEGEDWGWLIRDTDGDVVLKLDAAIDEAIRKENKE